MGSGRCECGGVRYRCVGDLRPVIDCHCDRCRRITGHHMAASGCATANLVLVSAATLRWYEPAEGIFYGFCGVCGSTLFWRSDTDPAWTSIAAGTLDLPTGLHTAAAWWTDHAADYHELDPTVDSYPREPPAGGSPTSPRAPRA